MALFTWKMHISPSTCKRHIDMDIGLILLLNQHWLLHILGSEVFANNLGGVWGLLLANLTLFQTKIYDFPYILDQTQNLIHYYRRELFSSFAKTFEKSFTLNKSYPITQTKQFPISNYNWTVKFYIQFQPKKGSQTTSFSSCHINVALRECPLPPQRRIFWVPWLWRGCSKSGYDYIRDKSLSTGKCNRFFFKHLSTR